MRLSEALHFSPNEARIARIRILAEGPMGAPRWDFDYTNHKHDPSPEALILGTYQHPTSGNELVGGVNLHYLTRQQIIDLQKSLPRIMRGSDLKQRYDIGTRVLPGVFNNAYRTYRSDYVQGVKPSELPYWYDKNTKVKKAQKTQRQKDMQRQVAAQRQAELRRQALQAVEPQEPELGPMIPSPQRISGMGSAQSVPTPDRQQISSAPGRQRVAPDSVQALRTRQQQGEAELQRLANMQRERAQQLASVKQKHDAAKAKQDAQNKLEKERQKNLQRLTRPDPEAAAEGDPLAVGESITYWDPARGRYITETVDI